MRALLLYALVFSLSGSAAPRDLWQSSKVEIKKRFYKTPHAGMSVAVFHHGKLHTAAFGYQDIEGKKRASTKTRYRYASVTKPMTAVAALQLAKSGKLDVDAPIQSYVRYYPKKAYTVTARHLAGHLGGIPHYVNCARECHIVEHYSTRRAIGIFKDWPLYWPPGSRYVYSSYGFNLLGAAVEGASKQSFANYLRRRIFRPAGMRSAAMDKPSADSGSKAKGYRMRGGRIVKSEFVDVSSRFAGGGLRGSVVDMARFGKALLGGKLLDDESLLQMTTPMSTSLGRGTDYGYGIGTFPSGGRWLLAHGGGQPETTTYLAIYPSEDLIVAVATNLEGQRVMVRDIADIVVARFLDDGAVRRRLIGSDFASDLVARTSDKLASHGRARLGYFGRQEHSATALVNAFASLRRLLRASDDAEELTVLFDLADEPAGDDVFPVAGAHMASVIAHLHGQEHLAQLRDPFAFVDEYIEACSRIDCPTALSIDFARAKNARLQKSWQERPKVARLGNDDDIKAALELPAAKVREDLVPEIDKVLRARIRQGDKKALALARRSAEVFARSPIAQLAFAEAALIAGDDDQGQEQLAKFLALTFDGGGLAKSARALRRRYPSQAQTILTFCTKERPGNAPCWDGLAALATDKSSARDAYERAEALDPGNAARARALKKLGRQ